MNPSTLEVRTYLLSAMAVAVAGCLALPGNVARTPDAPPPTAVVQPELLPEPPVAAATQIDTAPAAVPEAPAAAATTPAPAAKAAKPAAAPAAPAHKAVVVPPVVQAARAPVPVEAPRKETPVAVARPAALDLHTLESRLKDTKAIGIMSKLALKNQIDDLLARFRTAHASGGSVASLRPPYESLLAKVQSLLDGDPKLANDVSASREAIWGVLTDPVKFRSLS